MTHPSPAEKPYKRYHCQDANMWKFKGEDGKDVPGMYEANQHAAARTELALNSAHAAGLATAQAELKAANDNAEFIVAHLHQVVRLLREEVKYSRVHLIREEHPDGGTVAPFYSLNTHGTQADDCNYADARAAVDDAKALADPVIP